MCSWTTILKGVHGDTHDEFKNETNTSSEEQGPITYINIHSAKKKGQIIV